MNIEIYSKDNCSFCDLAIAKAHKLVIGIPENSYTVFKMGQDFGREELIENLPVARTFPQIKIDGIPIGGWAEFKDFDISAA